MNMMSKHDWKIGGVLLFACTIVLGLVVFFCVVAAGQITGRAVSDKREFRDLNKNGRLDPYEDSRQPVEKRVADLLSQMALKEKVGLIFGPIISAHPDGSLVEDQSFYSQLGTTEAIVKRDINHLGSFQPMPPEVIAKWNNHLQKLAESTRLGIPVTIYSDPRHGTDKPYTLNNVCMPGLSRWPDALGLAATRDFHLIEHFGKVAAKEYRACGITLALHPMADLATEPRWGRIAGTFGEDAELAAECVKAYIKGFQGDALGLNSVACMTKHFPGGGPQKDGWDCHYPYGKEQVYPGSKFEYHLIPFKAAVEVGTAQIMPYFGIPVGQTNEQVGFGFNREIVTDLLRNKLRFDGVISSDGGIISPYVSKGQMLSYAKCWGVEDLSIKQRFQKAIEAGLDHFLVEYATETVVELISDGSITEQRIDASARRILRDKFQLGLFDNPFVDPKKAKQICGSPQHQRWADLAQRKSIVLLKNKQVGGRKILPLGRSINLFIANINPKVASKYGKVVDSPNGADVAIIRLSTPYEKRKGLLEPIMRQGGLDFKGRILQRLRELMKAKPTIVCIYIERAAVIPEVAEEAAGLLVTFGASDAAVLDVVFGKFKPMGKLPIELPRSMEAVKSQKEDVPYDSENPLFAFGFGLTY